MSYLVDYVEFVCALIGALISLSAEGPMGDDDVKEILTLAVSLLMMIRKIVVVTAFASFASCHVQRSFVQWSGWLG